MFDDRFQKKQYLECNFLTNYLFYVHCYNMLNIDLTLLWKKGLKDTSKRQSHQK